jgi:hypothetical protein
MDPISNVDRIAILLRQKLLDRARANGPEKSKAGEQSLEAQTNALDAARALATIQNLDDRQRRRALVQGVLVEQFGPDLVNDAQFQQLVERVSSAIEGDEMSSAILSDLIAKLQRS